MTWQISPFKHSIDYELRYNISRRYPNRKIKWFAIIFATLLLGFFTAFNIATTGYDLEPLITTDPNTTLRETHWFYNNVFTWGDDKLRPRCQAQNVAIGSQFMTTNEGLQYTIKKIFSLSPNNEKMVYHTSVQYLNNTLENCQVNSVTLFLKKVDNSFPGSASWWSWAASTASASAQCNIINPTGNYTIAFDAAFPGQTKDFDYVAIDTAATHASIWWGTRIADNYFRGIEAVMSTGTNRTAQEQMIYTTGRLDYFAQDTQAIRDYSFFHPEFSFSNNDGGIVVNSNVEVGEVDEAHLYNNIELSMSRPLTEGSSFSKVFYSIILVDLGQDQLPNLLLSEDLLQYVLSPPDNFNRLSDGPLNSTSAFDWWRFTGISPPLTEITMENTVPMNQSYANMRNTTGPLGTQRASIYSQYTCSVPQPKSAPTIALIVLISNFILLQTAWLLFKFVADTYFSSADPTAMYCEGCLLAANAQRDGRGPYKPVDDQQRPQSYGRLSQTTTAADSVTRFSSLKSLPKSRTSSTRALVDDVDPEDDTIRLTDYRY